MKVPDFIFPSIVGKVGRLLPKAPPQQVLVFVLNRLLRQGILPADMSLLAGRHFEIDVLDAGVTQRFSATQEKFIVDHYTGVPDLRFAANTAEFIKIILREEDPDTLFFNRKLQIEGDTELGLIVKNLLDSIDWSNTPLARVIQS